MSKFLLFVSMGIAVAISGLASYRFTVDTLHYHYGIIVAIIHSIGIWWIMNFFTSILGDTIDIVFLCYVIDMDTEKIHNQNVHEIYHHNLLMQEL